MPESIGIFSGYRAMWMLVLYDLPQTEKEDKKSYAEFHAFLLNEGFSMLQFSVYARFFGSIESMEPHKKKIKENLPPFGKVRIMMLTDRQFGKTENYIGKTRAPKDEKPDQLNLF